MTWSYDASLIDPDTSTGRLQIVRLTIGDTDPDDELVQDEEIEYWLEQQGDSTRRASIAAVKAIIAKLARSVDTWMGHTRIELSQKSRHYRLLLEELKASSTDGILTIKFSPTGYADKAARDSESDRIPPAFNVGQDDIC